MTVHVLAGSCRWLNIRKWRYLYCYYKCRLTIPVCSDMNRLFCLVMQITVRWALLNMNRSSLFVQAPVLLRELLFV